MWFVILVIGASGIIAQLILIRELLVFFQGNELSIGLILSNWLISEALGSYIFRYLKITINRYKALIITFALMLPFLIILSNLFRPIFKIIPGEIVTIPAMYLFSMLTLFPIGFLHGGLFTATISLTVQKKAANYLNTTGSVYILENLGTIFGGVILSFILIVYLSSLRIAILVSIGNFIAILIIKKQKSHFYRYSIYPCLIILIFIYIFVPKIENWLEQKKYPLYHILSSFNTLYNKITVLNREEQYVFLTDGNPTITVPSPDQNFIEDFVNFPLLQHPNPKQVLIISGGVGGVINQMLEYNLKKIIYLELNSYLINTIKKFSTHLSEKELTDQRVSIVNKDARLFLMQDTSKYDLIFVNLSLPLSLQTNRLYTKEFFALCRDRLNQQGILVTISPSSLVYIDSALQQVTASHLITLKQVFPLVTFLKGDFNLYLSTTDSSNFIFCADTIYNRFVKRNISSKLFSLGYIQYRLQHVSYLNNQNEFQKIYQHINTDGVPRGLLYNLAYKNTMITPSLKNFFELIKRINLKIILIVIFIIFTLLLLFTKNRRSIYLVYVILTTGITAMILTLVLSLGFQIRYGYLYYQINLLITIFISGNVLGGFISNITNAYKKHSLLISEAFLIILLMLIVLSLRNQAYPSLLNNPIDFYLLLLTAGFLVGFQFPLTNRYYYNYDRSIIKVAGQLYASDLLGGFVSAIITPIILIPIIGMQQTLFLTMIFKITSLLLILTLK